MRTLTALLLNSTSMVEFLVPQIVRYINDPPPVFKDLPIPVVLKHRVGRWG